MKIRTFVNRPIGENAYIVSDDTREAVIIDCGALFPEDQQNIADYIDREALTIVAHILTHGHFDHMFGSQWVANVYGCRPKIHAADLANYEGAAELASKFFHRRLEFAFPAIGSFYNEQTTLPFGNHTLHIIHTPGHTPGGCCLYCKEEGVLFSGDSIFQESIGRTDLEGGDQATLITSLLERVLTLPEDVVIYPGHGPATTVGDEKLLNPYLV